jgi:hypothetical protein
MIHKAIFGLKKHRKEDPDKDLPKEMRRKEDQTEQVLSLKPLLAKEQRQPEG